MPREASGSASGPGRSVACECGEVVTAKSLDRHRGTAKHLANMAQLAGESENDWQAGPTDPPAEPDGAPGVTAGPGRPKLTVLKPKVSAMPSKGASLSSKQGALDEAAGIATFIQADLIQTIAPVAPVVATYWDGYLEENTRNWAILCRNHPGLLAGTLKAADYLAYYALGKFATGLVIGIGVETRMLAADNRLAQAAGITAAWEQVQAEYAEMEQEVASNYRLGEPDLDTDPGTFPGLGGEIFRTADG